MRALPRARVPGSQGPPAEACLAWKGSGVPALQASRHLLDPGNQRPQRGGWGAAGDLGIGVCGDSREEASRVLGGT